MQRTEGTGEVARWHNAVHCTVLRNLVTIPGDVVGGFAFVVWVFFWLCCDFLFVCFAFKNLYK